MRTADFYYELPPELIAQDPMPERDQSRLLVLERATGLIFHRQFRDLPCLLRRGDLLVFNNSKVIPARLRGRKVEGGGQFEVLLLAENQINDWWVLFRPGKRVRPGSRLRFFDAISQPAEVEATVIEKNGEGHCRLGFSGVANILNHLDALGEVPLPPYITRPPHMNLVADRERYQTVYAEAPGSVAAPTAGLHFTRELLETIRQAGSESCCVTLHVGLGTFAPVKTEVLENHPMHEEHFAVSAEAARQINEAKTMGRRIVAVGTTSVRVLESVAARNQGKMAPGSGTTRLFIYPPYRFQLVDALVTNFHLPQSTLLMLVCALAAPGLTRGREWVLGGYAEAIQRRYRFYSYGDAMFIR